MVEEQDKMAERTLEEQALFDAMCEEFDDRQMGLINNCRDYAHRDPSGLPGHNIMIIVSKLYDMLEEHF